MFIADLNNFYQLRGCHRCRIKKKNEILKLDLLEELLKSWTDGLRSIFISRLYFVLKKRKLSTMEANTKLLCVF